MRVTAQITEDALNEASKMISEAQKPMIFVGGGAVISEGISLHFLLHDH